MMLFKRSKGNKMILQQKNNETQNIKQKKVVTILKGNRLIFSKLYKRILP